jgi:hypothetical protein
MDKRDKLKIIHTHIHAYVFQISSLLWRRVFYLCVQTLHWATSLIFLIWILSLLRVGRLDCMASDVAPLYWIGLRGFYSECLSLGSSRVLRNQGQLV